MYQVTVVNLLKNSAYQVQIRHKSNPSIINPLWSDWSQEVIVPAVLEVEKKIGGVAQTPFKVLPHQGCDWKVHEKWH